MGDKKHKSSSKRFRKWFRRKHKSSSRADPYRTSELSDGEGDETEDSMCDIYASPLENDPPTSSNELRIFVGTWNVAGRSPVGSLAVDLEEWLNLRDAADIYVLGFQEVVPLKPHTVIGAEDPTEAQNWNLLIGKTLNHRHHSPWLMPMLTPIYTDYQCSVTPDRGRMASFSMSEATPIRSRIRGDRYKLMASKKMVGIFISVWMKKVSVRRYIVSNVKVCSVGCGVMGFLGNKGSVSVSMSIEGSSFCFIAAHLASGEKKGDECRRNSQVSEIFRRTTFSPPCRGEDNPRPLTILGHDQIFWFGDLNYRLYLEDNSARHLIRKADWKALQAFDQLRREQEDGGVFQGWKEGNIEFAPTYKYSSSNYNRYTGAPPSRSGEKQRTPAWCDRILWYGKGVKQLSYFRSESKFSDHRPVSALFSTVVEVLNLSDPRFMEMKPILPNVKAEEIGTSRIECAVQSSLLTEEKDTEAEEL